MARVYIGAERRERRRNADRRSIVNRGNQTKAVKAAGMCRRTNPPRRIMSQARGHQLDRRKDMFSSSHLPPEFNRRKADRRRPVEVPGPIDSTY